MPRRLLVRQVGVYFAAAVFAFLCLGFQGGAAGASLPQEQDSASAVLSENPDRELSPAALKEDFERLWYSLEEAHAGLYRYVSRADMDKHFEALERQLSRPLRISEFYAGAHPRPGPEQPCRLVSEAADLPADSPAL
jgi:hypothetical protein